MLTRNDTSFVPDLSEQQLLWETNPDLGSTQGGGGDAAMAYCTSHGVVADSVCPYDQSGSRGNWDVPVAGDPWPLENVFPAPDNWSNHVWKSTANSTPFVTSTTAGIKTALETQGPLLTGVWAGNDMFSSVSDLKSNYHTPANGVDHAVVIVGFQDDISVPGGGYWIIKNSWGSSDTFDGYWYIAYGNVENHKSTQAYSGPVFYNGAMAAATWSGGAGTWAAGNATKWNSGAYAWENKETTATFGGTGGAVSVSGKVIAHGLTINSTGYSFAPADGNSSLTITKDGITANQNASFSTPIFIGAPQNWNVASGKTLNVSGAVHTIVSDLTFTGAGTKTISGQIDGGGVINLQGGAKPGGLIQAGSGSVTLTGTTSFSGDITANSGAGTLSIAPSGGGAVRFDGAFFGGGTVSFNSNSVTLGGGNSNFTGTLSFQQACPVTFVPASGATGRFACVLNNNGSVTQNGPGTTILTGTNTYTGSTTLSNGVLQANSGAGLPSGSMLLLNGGVLQGNGGAVTFTRTLSSTSGSNRFYWPANSVGGGFSAGTGTMTVKINNGTGTVTWGSTAGSNLIGTLKLSSNTAAAMTDFQNGINLNGATRTIFVDDNPNSTSDYAKISNVISGTGTSSSLVKAGPGFLLVSSTSTYGGSTTISGGVLQETLPSASFLNLDGGVWQTNTSTDTSLTRSLGTSGSTVRFTSNGGGFAGGSGNLTVNLGNGANLTWSNSGNNLIGTLKLNSTSATRTTTFQNAINLNGGARILNVDDNPNSSSDYAVLSGAITGGSGSSLTKTGSGTLYIQGNSGNTYSGATTITGGDIYLNKSSGYAIPGDLYLGGTTNYYVNLVGANQMPSTASINFTAGDNGAYPEFKLLGHSITVAGISNSTQNGTIENTWNETTYGAATLTVNNSTDCYYNGDMRDSYTGSGALSLTKTNSGTLTLRGGGISYSGQTTVSGGKLVLLDTDNSNILTHNITDNATLELSCTNSDPNFHYNMSATISGSGSLIKSGSATVTIGGTAAGNTYTGSTTITDGHLVLSRTLTSGYAIPGNIVFTGPANSFLEIAGSNQINPNSSLTWNSTDGWPEFKLLGNNVTVGSINNSTGRGSIENTWNETNYGTATLTVQNSSNCEYNGEMRDSYAGSGSLALTKSGNATLTLSGNISFTGPLTVNAGTLNLNGTSSFSGNVTVNGGNLVGNVGSAFGPGNASRTLTVNAGGTLTFASGDMYGGHTTTNVPTLSIQGGTVTNSGSGVHNALNNVTLNGGTLSATTDAGEWAAWNLNGTVTSTGTSTITYAGGNGQVMLQSGDNGANTNFVVSSGTLTVAAPLIDGRGGGDISSRATGLTKSGSGTMILMGANTYTGTTTLSDGTLSLAKTSSSGYAISTNFVFNGSANTFLAVAGTGSYQIAPSTTLTWNGTSASWPEFKLLGQTVTVAGISNSTGCGSIENTWNETTYGTATLIVNNSTDCSYNGEIRNSYIGSGALAVVKNGTGKLTLVGTSTSSFTGGLTINNGIVDYEQANNLPSSVTINSPGHLYFNGQLIGGPVATESAEEDHPVLDSPLTTIENNGDFGIGEYSSLTLGEVTGTGTLTICDNARLSARSIVQDALIIGGALPTVIAVPEPSSLVLLALAGLALSGAYFRRK